LAGSLFTFAGTDAGLVGRESEEIEMLLRGYAIPFQAVRRFLLLSLMVLFAYAVVLATPGALLAQPPEGAAPAAPAEPAAAPAPPAAAPAKAKADEPPKKQSALMWWYSALGWRYTLGFLFLSMSFVALFIMNLLSAQRNAVCPPALIEGFEALLNEKQYQEAYELAKADDSFLGRVLAAGLARVSSGYPKALEAMQEVAEDESMKIDHRLSYISLISSISTMTGLLGTVDGMILSFIVIAESPTTPKPSQLAQGISMAMVTTLVGLVLAIPAICAFNIFRNRFQRLTLEVGIASERLMRRFEGATAKQE
jgi:biopolymer transport protein ExbB